MVEGFRGYDFLKELRQKNQNFSEKLDVYLINGRVRFFSDEEWDRIQSQNFLSLVPEIKKFYDMFFLGYNKGNCIGASRQLSYSYDDVDIVTGILPLLKGTLNAEKEGGHGWLETKEKIIDTSLLLVIDKSLKDEFGYIEEQRITAYQLLGMANYQTRKEFVNDKSLKNKQKGVYGKLDFETSKDSNSDLKLK